MAVPLEIEILNINLFCKVSPTRNKQLLIRLTNVLDFQGTNVKTKLFAENSEVSHGDNIKIISSTKSCFSKRYKEVIIMLSFFNLLAFSSVGSAKLNVSKYLDLSAWDVSETYSGDNHKISKNIFVAEKNNPVRTFKRITSLKIKN